LHYERINYIQLKALSNCKFTTTCKKSLPADTIP
jgi:hypothetical protein